MTVFDFNSLQDVSHTFCTSIMRKGVADVHGTIGVLPLDGLSAQARVISPTRHLLRHGSWLHRLRLLVYSLVAILKREQKIDRNFGEILQILSITLFDKVPMNQILRRFYLRLRFFSNRFVVSRRMDQP